jgi:hypothetical protein
MYVEAGFHKETIDAEIDVGFTGTSMDDKADNRSDTTLPPLKKARKSIQKYHHTERDGAGKRDDSRDANGAHKHAARTNVKMGTRGTAGILHHS